MGFQYKSCLQQTQSRSCEVGYLKKNWKNARAK
jgi:hypothetical protein